MAIIVKETGTPQKQVSPGSHLAICYRIVDAGTVHDKVYDKERHRVILTWEIPGETIEIDKVAKPMSISVTYTASLQEKSTLRKHLEMWRGKAFTKEELEGFELGKVLGVPCLLSVIHDEKGRAKVAGIMAPPRGTPRNEPYNPMVEYSVSEGDNTVFRTLPDWLQERVTESGEWAAPAARKEAGGAPATEAIEEPFDDLPFRSMPTDRLRARMTGVRFHEYA